MLYYIKLCSIILYYIILYYIILYYIILYLAAAKNEARGKRLHISEERFCTPPTRGGGVRKLLSQF